MSNTVAHVVLLARINVAEAQLREERQLLEAAIATGDVDGIARHKLGVAYRQACVAKLEQDFESLR